MAGRRTAMARGRAAGIAAGGALAIHAAFLAAVVFWHRGPIALPIVAPNHGGAAPDAPAAEPLGEAAGAVAVVDLVELPADDSLAAPVLAAPGVGDQRGIHDTHPAPRARADVPGTRPAARGGEGTGGPEDWGGRDDDETLRAELWNDPDRYRSGRHRTGPAAEARSPEALARETEAGFDDRRGDRTLARQGSERGRATGGTAASGGLASAGAPARPWPGKDALADPGARPEPKRTTGATRASAQRPLVDTGAPATEADSRGPVAEPRSVAARSDERDPMPLEFSRLSAGGSALGVRGDGKSGAAGARAGQGTAASRTATRAGTGPQSVRAGRQNSYFRGMYRRVDRVVQFPRSLALSLDQGEVLVAFTLRSDGSISDLKVVIPSGFKEFDREIVRAIRRAAPFGPVPASVRGGAERIVVKAPYSFRNPVIR